MKWITLIDGTKTCVDDNMFEKLNKYCWYRDSRGSTEYAYRSEYKDGQSKRIQMHRTIIGGDDDRQVDHINGYGLDNRRSNLRYATVQQNAFNRKKPNVKSTSQFKGVLQRKGTDYWLARIKFNNKHVELGRFQEEDYAGAAYNYAAKLFFGEYRRENENLSRLPREMEHEIFGKCLKKIIRENWIVTTDFLIAEAHRFNALPMLPLTEGTE